MKKSNSFYGWLFACVSLVVLLGLSVYLGITGWYFTAGTSQQTDMVLGNNVEIAINKNSASTASFTISGGFLPGEELSQIIGVKNTEEEKSVYLRAKVYIFMSNSAIADMNLVTTSNWTLHDDGYYYYNDKLISQGKIGLCSAVVIGEGSSLRGERSYIMTIAVESLDEDLNVEDVWGVDPVQNI